MENKPNETEAEKIKRVLESAPAIPRRLTIVNIKGTDFYLDTRLGELRQVDNPHNTIKL